MGTAKALRRVEQLARIVTTYETELQNEDRKVQRGGHWISLHSVVRELRLALVDLDIGREEEELPAVESA